MASPWAESYPQVPEGYVTLYQESQGEVSQPVANACLSFDPTQGPLPRTTAPPGPGEEEAPQGRASAAERLEAWVLALP